MPAETPTFIDQRSRPRQTDNQPGPSDIEKKLLMDDYRAKPALYLPQRSIVFISGRSGGGKTSFIEQLEDHMKRVHHLEVDTYIPSRDFRKKIEAQTGETALGPMERSVETDKEWDIATVEIAKNFLKTGGIQAGRILLVEARLGGMLGYHDPLLRKNSYRVLWEVEEETGYKRIFKREKPRIEKANQPAKTYNAILMTEMPILFAKDEMRPNIELDSLRGTLPQLPGVEGIEEEVRGLRDGRIDDAIDIFKRIKLPKKRIPTTDLVHVVNATLEVVAQETKKRNEYDIAIWNLAHPWLHGRDPLDLKTGFYQGRVNATPIKKHEGLWHFTMQALLDGFYKKAAEQKSFLQAAVFEYEGQGTT